MELNPYELREIASLCGRLDEHQTPGSACFVVDCTVIDSNGESAGEVRWNSDQESYTFYPSHS